MEVIGELGESINLPQVATNIELCQVYRATAEIKLKTSAVIGTDCIGRCKSIETLINNHNYNIHLTGIYDIISVQWFL